MTVWIARLSLVAAVILALALGIQTWRLDRESRRTVAARAAAQSAALNAAGWQRAAEASQSDLARVVPALNAEISALLRTGATLAGTSHWTGNGAPVPVPCIASMAPPAGAPIAAHPGPSPDGLPGEPLVDCDCHDGTDRLCCPPTVAVTPHVLIDDAVALDDAGGIYVARQVQARLSVGETWASEWADVTPDPGSTTAVDPRIGAAWREYLNPPYRLDAAIGASIGINGLGIVGQLSGGRGRLGWFAQADYVVTDPSASRAAAGGKFTLKK